jgi:hypothetical protein
MRYPAGAKHRQGLKKPYNIELILNSIPSATPKVDMFSKATKYGLVVMFFILAGKAGAMDRFTALSQIESGDNDFAVGRAGEISRYQIRRELWQKVTNAPLSEATNSAVAISVAKSIALARMENFRQQYNRPPTDSEFYILWNAPGEIDHPSHVVRSRASLYANLVSAVD